MNPSKVMFISSSIPSGLECWSENHAATYEKSESKVFKNIKVFGENVRTNEKTNTYKTLESCW